MDHTLEQKYNQNKVYLNLTQGSKSWFFAATYFDLK